MTLEHKCIFCDKGTNFKDLLARPMCAKCYGEANAVPAIKVTGPYQPWNPPTYPTWPQYPPNVVWISTTTTPQPGHAVC